MPFPPWNKSAIGERHPSMSSTHCHPDFPTSGRKKQPLCPAYPIMEEKCLEAENMSQQSQVADSQEKQQKYEMW